MREIKFRTWDVKAHRYQTFDGFDRWGMIQSSKDNTWSATGSDMLLVTDNPEFFIWEQYTGLTDKNGIEIYEGDILTSGENDFGVVEWNNDSASFLINFGELQDMTGVSEWAVNIGNIHENKELLK